uniref:Uncharacterized protein n=1 Tax=Anguilla anguilla TaxID=7936 RepID=A0A0E9VDU3_ANGAN
MMVMHTQTQTRAHTHTHTHAHTLCINHPSLPSLLAPCCNLDSMTVTKKRGNTEQQ